MASSQAWFNKKDIKRTKDEGKEFSYVTPRDIYILLMKKQYLEGPLDVYSKLPTTIIEMKTSRTPGLISVQNLLV